MRNKVLCWLVNKCCCGFEIVVNKITLEDISTVGEAHVPMAYIFREVSAAIKLMIFTKAEQNADV